MIASFFAKFFSYLLPWLAARAAEYINEKLLNAQDKSKVQKTVDIRLTQFNDAFKKVVNGEPVTPEQKEELKSAIRNFSNILDRDGLV